MFLLDTNVISELRKSRRDPGLTQWTEVERDKPMFLSVITMGEVHSGIEALRRRMAHGNIYRAEVLFRHGIGPRRPGRSLSRSEWDTIWGDLVALMTDGVKLGRIDTVRSEHLPEVMGRAPRVDRHGGEVYVYRRDGQECLVCGTAVAIAKRQGRNLFWCPVCQAG